MQSPVCKLKASVHALGTDAYTQIIYFNYARKQWDLPEPPLLHDIENVVEADAFFVTTGLTYSFFIRYALPFFDVKIISSDI